MAIEGACVGESGDGVIGDGVIGDIVNNNKDVGDEEVQLSSVPHKRGNKSSLIHVHVCNDCKLHISDVPELTQP